jgi:hypothetical protein
VGGASGHRGAGRPGAFYRGLRARLIEFAESQFRLSHKHPDGTTERAHLEAAARQGDRRAAAELRVDPLPDAIRPVWNAFTELHEARGSSGHAPAAVTWQDIAAWQSVSGIELSRWEVECLRALDGVAMAAFSRQMAAQNKGT